MIKTMTRTELYELVWSKPVYQLAKEFGLSDKGLAKKCIKHSIPKPPLGYWTQLECGKNPKKTPLPAAGDPSLETVTFSGRLDAKGNKTQDPRIERVQSIDVERVARRRLEIVSKSKAMYKNGRPSEHGFIKVRQDVQALDIRVTKSSLNRAHRLFLLIDEISKICGFEGLHYVKRSHGDTSYSAVQFDDESIHISVTEETKRAETNSKYGSWTERSYNPTGKLTLHLHGTGYGERSTWRDGKKKIEERLPDLVSGLANAAVSIRESRLKREQWQLEWEKRQRLEKLESDRKDLFQRLSQDIREYHKLKSELDLIVSNISEEIQESHHDRVNWAKAHVESKNPLLKLDDYFAKPNR